MTESTEMVQSVNQQCYVILLKSMWQVYLGHAIHIARLVISVLKMTTRLDLQQTYQVPFEVMKPHFDIALAKYFSTFATCKNGVALWWAARGAPCSVVCMPCCNAAL